MLHLPTDELREAAGIGVAGNFAGHLAQAGEAADFVGVDAPDTAPKGIFPWFLPGNGGFLGDFPLSCDRLSLPASSEPVNLQIEPEAGVVFEATWDNDGVSALSPVAIGAFNDCSIRRPGARKISEKKNWGDCSKGFAERLFAIAGGDLAGSTQSLRLASFLRRDGALHEYGIDSPLAGYSYYGTVLTDWIGRCLAEQRGGETPLEDVGEQLARCGRPTRIVVGIGATRYTSFGESNFLKAGDESIVVLYDDEHHGQEEVIAALGEGSSAPLQKASVLLQRVA